MDPLQHQCRLCWVAREPTDLGAASGMWLPLLSQDSDQLRV